MSGPSRKRDQLAISCALALAEAFFPQCDGTVSGPHAHLLVTGRIDAWPGYWDLAEPERLLLARLLRHRSDTLASEEFFGKALRTMAADGELTGYRPDGEGAIRSEHGLPPLEHADRLLAAMDRMRRGNTRPTPVAEPGRYRTTLRVARQGPARVATRAVYNLSDLTAQPKSALTVTDAPRLDVVELDFDELRKMAGRIDAVRGEEHRRERVDELFRALRDEDGERVADALKVHAGGGIRILQAPTGFGKSVLMEVQATLAAEKGVPIALVVPTRAAALRLAYQIETNLDRLGIPASCVPLLSPSRLMEDAEKAAIDHADGFGEWAYARLGYGCALAAATETDDPVDTWRPGGEPCRNLYSVRSDRSAPKACPWRTSCGKFRLMREATTADVIVTAHQTLYSGRMHVPLTVGEVTSDRVGVEEFLLRRCQLITIDELDQFQAAVISRSAQQLVLADGPRETPLDKLDGEFRSAFGQVPANVDGEVRPILSDLQLLAMGYAAGLTHGWLPPVRPHRPGYRTDHWIVPRGYDAWLTARLLGLGPEDRSVTADEVEALQQLYPTPSARPVPPLRLAGIKDDDQATVVAEITEILRAVAAGCRDAVLPVHLGHLTDLLRPVVPDEGDRSKVAVRMVRRAHLEPLRHRLSELFFHTAHLRAVGAESAEVIADAMGGLANWAAMPASPLGRLFLAFKERFDLEAPERSKLAVTAFGGDPHGYTLYLGELTARAHTGVPRAILGLSATSYLPGAPHHHVHQPPAWSVPDTDATGVTVHACHAFTGDGTDPIRISGVQGRQRELNLRELGESLYRSTLVTELARLTARREESSEPGRDLILVTTTSYASCLDLAEGMSHAGARAEDICVVTRRGDDILGTDPRWRTIPSDQVEDFPATGARILIAPLSPVERGVNILDGTVSALGAIYVVVRPIPILDEPAELLAHINHRLWTESRERGATAPDPLKQMEARVKDAGKHFEEIVRSAQYFRSQPGWVQRGVVAEIIISLIQLVGRARRGGTPGEIHLVDHAFFDTDGGSDLPYLITQLREAWQESGELDRLLSLYGPTLQAFFDFAARHRPTDASQEETC